MPELLSSDFDALIVRRKKQAFYGSVLALLWVVLTAEHFRLNLANIYFHKKR